MFPRRRSLTLAWLPWAAGVLALGCDELGQGTRPRLSLSRTEVTFGTVVVGRSDALEVRLSNTGGAPLDVASIGVTEDSDPAYSIESTRPLPWTLAPGAAEIFKVVFAPLSSGRHVGTVVIASDDPSVPEATLPATALEIEGRLVIEPADLDFGVRLVGASVDRAFTIRNEGAAPIELVDARFDGDPALTLAPQAYPLAILPGELAALPVTFAPTACGAATAILELATTDPTTPFARLSAAGQTPGPSASLSPRSGRLQATPVGGHSGRRFTLRSRGTAPLAITGVSVRPNSAVLGATPELALAAPIGAVSLPPGESLDIDVVFTPSATGERTGVLRIDSDDCGAPLRQLALTGLGTRTSDGPYCALAFDTATLTFGALARGNAIDRTAVLASVGPGPCVLGEALPDVRASSGFLLVSAPPAGTVLEPLDERSFVVRFTPSSPGQRTGRIIAEATDPSRGDAYVEATISVLGSSGSAAISVDPLSHDFGPVRVGCVSKPTSFTVESVGYGEAEILRAGPVNGLPLEVLQSLPATLAPGASATLVARLHPRALGPVSGHVEILSNDDAQPVRQIDISGEAVEGSGIVDRLEQLSTPAADLLLVVDNSGSMLNEQEALQRSFLAFAETARAHGGDYQIGVITTDTPYFRGYPQIVRQTDPDPVSELASNTRVGTAGSGIERGMLMALQALSPPIITTTNRGFLRPGRPLEVIFVGDEDDQSSFSVDDFIQRMGRLMGASRQFRVSAIVGPTPLGCGPDALDGADPGFRFIEAATRTGGVIGSICSSDFSAILARIAEATFGLRDLVALRAEPEPSAGFRVVSYPSTAECEADPTAAAGTPIDPSLWRYDPTRNAIRLIGAAIPAQGACVQVAYTLQCLSPN